MTRRSTFALHLLLGALALLAVTTGCLWDDESPPAADGGSATCFSPTPVDCDGVCVDTARDSRNCGSCGNECETACLHGGCINCPNVDGRWDIVGGDCPVAYCQISQSACGGSVSCYDSAGELAGSGTVEVMDGSVGFSASAGSCDLDLVGNDASGPCTSLGITVCNVTARRF